MGSKPKPPKIQGGAKATTSGQFFSNGRLVSSSLYDPKTRQYTNTVNQNPEDLALQNQSRLGVLQLVPKINQVLDTSPEAKAAYADEFYKPALRAIQLQAQEGTDQANTRFSQTGMGNSVGYGRYVADRIADKAMGQAADAKSNSIIQGEQLQGIRLAPLIQAFQAYQNADNNIYNRQFSDLAPAFQAQQTGFDQRQRLYDNELRRYDLSRPTGGSGIGSAIGAGLGLAGTALQLIPHPAAKVAGAAASTGGAALQGGIGSRYGSAATLPTMFSGSM